MKWIDCERIDDTQWVDHEWGEIFNSLETYNSSTNAAFLCEPYEFQSHPKYGVPDFLGHPIDHQDSECIISGFKYLTRFQDSRILIIGAGPSVVECADEWTPHINQYDYIWSCNHYYQCDELENMKIDFCTLGNQVDYSSSILSGRLDRDNSIFGIDMNISMTTSDFLRFMKTQNNNKIFFSTRFFGKIGSVPRMIILAILSGARHISIIGMDGSKPVGKNSVRSSTVFRDEKDFPKIEDGRNGPQLYSIIRRHYVIFWDYILNHLNEGREVSFKNYGKKYKFNLTGDIPENPNTNGG